MLDDFVDFMNSLAAFIIQLLLVIVIVAFYISVFALPIVIVVALIIWILKLIGVM